MISFCIPRVDKEETKDFIYNKLNKLQLGKIQYIKEVPCRNNDQYKKIFIHYTEFDKNKQFQHHFTKRGYLNIVYDNHWYWKLYKAYHQVPS
jgi:inorganic pyrophosphatase